MGAVLLGEHRFLGDKVAIKVLHGFYANDKNVTQRFFQEASQQPAQRSRELPRPMQKSAVPIEPVAIRYCDSITSALSRICRLRSP
jgi:hypothetical protein